MILAKPRPLSPENVGFRGCIIFDCFYNVCPPPPVRDVTVSTVTLVPRTRVRDSDYALRVRTG